MTRTHGLIIGKFLPVHLGHQFLVETALTHADLLTIVAFDNPAYSIPIETRLAWLRALHPRARILGVPDLPRTDFGDEGCWQTHVLRLRAHVRRPVTHVFSSEPYGEELARRLGAVHLAVDPDRRRVPISGTRVRANPHRERAFLHPLVYRHFVARVALYGAESTGKTTLAQCLAAEYATKWVPEFAKDYLGDRVCAPEDLLAIAGGQAEAEERALAEAQRYLFSDTTLATTAFWSREYFGVVDPAVEALARATRDSYALSFLCGDDIPWEDDGLRRRQAERSAHQARIRADLDRRGIRYVELRGTLEARLARAREALTSR